jgi:NAD dependent epimerase/dehydratase family
LTGSGVASLHVEAGVIIDSREGDSVEILDAVASGVDAWFDSNRAGLYHVASHEGILTDVPPPRPPLTTTGTPPSEQSRRPALRPLIPLPRLYLPGQEVVEAIIEASELRRIAVPATPRSDFPQYPYRSLSQRPNDFLYSYDKILVEQVVMNEPDLPGTVLRFPQVFGPNDRQHRLMAYLKSMDEGKDILLDEGKAEWRWTRGYVENVAVAIVLAVTDQKAIGRVYNVGEKKAQREIDWIKKIGRLAGWRGEVKTVPRVALPEHLREPYDWSHDLAADTNRIRRELGYEETVSPKEALRRTIAWERANPPKRAAGSQTPVQPDAAPNAFGVD